ncbi:MAG TPA: type IV pilus modification protein PilV [Gammaproteobacteria bacterium]
MTGQRGFSLIEVMVALLVLSVGLLGIAALHGQGLGASRVAMYRTVAVNLAADMAERIRVNRLARDAYNDDPEDNGCDPVTGDGDDCTPAQMAAHDLFVWQQQLAAQLPNGEGDVQFADGTPPVYTITVTWDETGIGETSYTTAIEVPEL